MKRDVRFHGVVSLVIMALLAGIAVASLLMVSVVHAAIYAALVACGGGLVLAAFCSKCVCRKSGCRHVVFGPAISLFLNRKEGPYSVVEIALTVIGCGMIVVYPHIGLVRSPPLLLLFWLTAAVLIVEIVKNICPGCENRWCPARKE